MFVHWSIFEVFYLRVIRVKQSIEIPQRIRSLARW